MGSLSIWHWLILIVVGMLLFGGKGKISDLMGDFAKGINSFKKGLKEDDSTPVSGSDPKNLDHKAVETVPGKVEDKPHAG
jgi:sec-independent protein translocase protein TatA